DTYTLTNIEYINQQQMRFSFNQEYFSSAQNILTIYNQAFSEPTDKTPGISLALEYGLLMTPNGDGNYDKLIIQGIENVILYELKIYDRYDNLVFATVDKNFQWNGFDYFSGLPVPEGSYKYELDADGVAFYGQFLIER
ncbi:MAG: T9SS type B sorting domain-containing protein, partial [Bacteroidia bacterium]|nr:T9SS type B sorting domain-containing protein [Bacteroidia bacterium]